MKKHYVDPANYVFTNLFFCGGGRFLYTGFKNSYKVRNLVFSIFLQKFKNLLFTFKSLIHPKLIFVYGIRLEYFISPHHVDN